MKQSFATHELAFRDASGNSKTDGESLTLSAKKGLSSWRGPNRLSRLITLLLKLIQRNIIIGFASSSSSLFFHDEHHHEPNSQSQCYHSECDSEDCKNEPVPIMAVTVTCVIAGAPYPEEPTEPAAVVAAAIVNATVCANLVHRSREYWATVLVECDGIDHVIGHLVWCWDKSRVE